MILFMGVRTTSPVMVAYKPIGQEEEETSAIADLLGKLISESGFHYGKYDHSMVVHYDPPGKSNDRREVLIAVDHGVEGVETRIFPSVRAAFIVFKDTDTTIERYYEQLLDYMEQVGLKASREIYSIEIMYVPEDLDEQDYLLEIMIPLAD